ncbi:DegT/DnrJ/EryC1/StrS family aminotransferase [Sphingomonas alba]|uniref:DegT/DnrJ/EryC1/StrS family aminotransferase n=1 Tax=Sphingomonas alba TaxID=2908208 RepID=A0ABT0RJ98_9SPHN|nr:DegT/DnrJ/EryC1/StrS family aminotransferase [Sphingomonas alba]MCL6682701.1 DegT/DnrJ/EryC1/StrS family aminotransferase [Sphingomonas alba]
MSNGPIYVTRPSLPPLAELLPLLEEMWDSRVLTNNGPFHQKFEAALTAFLEAEHVSLVSNGMLALEAAIDAAQLTGEVVTTPYSFVATTHAVRRANLQPVFVDIRPHDLNIDPDAVEAAITEKTSAIVAVHCYGNPCNVDALRAIAERHGLKLIYDAAHAFGVRRNGQSLLAHGDFSILSFHATKVFNTFEGGVVIAASQAGKAAVDSLRNFGIASETSIPNTGGNAKMSEFNAALGLLQLDRFAEAREARRQVDTRYREALTSIEGIEPLALPDGVEPNFSYFPVLVGEDYPISRDALYEALKAENIFARRYFYPLLSSLPMYRDLASADPANLPVATEAAKQILCLPIYEGLSEADQDRVIRAVQRPS